MWEFRQEWWDFGYSLGDILYSVPLAPCEETKIATVDWRRHDYAKRQTALDESHFQDTTVTRDELINETMRTISDKHVSDTSVGASVGFPAGPTSVCLAVGVSDMDSAASTSMDASKNLNDRVRQTSTTLRNTRAFAITEVTQEEESVVRTRVLRNHNHCHTVTFQYYEVIRHFLISTRLDRMRPAIFIPFTILTFTKDLVMQYGYLLRRALLDTTLEPAFDILLGVRQPEPPAETQVSEQIPSPEASPFDSDKEVTNFRISVLDYFGQSFQARS
jgi:hypothetical protein